MTPTPGPYIQKRRILYADCFSGISGDMFLSALLQLGYPEGQLHRLVKQLGLSDATNLLISQTSRAGITGVKIDISPSDNQPLRTLSAIQDILTAAPLPEKIKDQSLAVFSELARAEAKIHNRTPETIHFHEVGAIDTIIDIVGVLAALDHLGITSICCSPLPFPRGFITCAHGMLPLPAPAVNEILCGIPCYGVNLEQELVTPTGAALIKVLAEHFGQMPPMIIEKTGYGAGTHTLSDGRPNLLRLVMGESCSSTEAQEISVIECHLDDWNGEQFPHLCNTLLKKGAVDVTLTPLLMKKGRPGYRLTVLSPLHLQHQICNTLFCQTTTIGMRIHKEERQTLPREIVEIDTPWGKTTAKRVTTPTGIRIYPEYESCRSIAENNDVPLADVYAAIYRSKK